MTERFRQEGGGAWGHHVGKPAGGQPVTADTRASASRGHCSERTTPALRLFPVSLSTR